ncbi:MAG: polysaccharide deacetylase family protein, partial [Oscillospiraceae bacterium]|nr:polysaccharide deacetylase family protein [Oscillospiraceae bacterium]
MKKSIILALALLALPGCGTNAGKNADSPGITTQIVPDILSSNHENVSVEEPADNGGTKNASANNGNAKKIPPPPRREIEYGERTGAGSTYTGLEPLPKADFSSFNAENTYNLPTAKIDHSFGVSVNEKPHEISVGSQDFFDSRGYFAVTYDNKTEEKVLYLTFDCGYENGYTEKLLDILKEKNVPAAFFCTLHDLKSSPEIIAREINEGHIVGNHTVGHPSFAEISRTKMVDEIKFFDDYLREHFGYSAPYFRNPKGEYTESSLELVQSLGYKSFFWSVAYVDWDTTKQKGAGYAYEKVTSRLHPGAIILLHTVS